MLDYLVNWFPGSAGSAWEPSVLQALLAVSVAAMCGLKNGEAEPRRQRVPRQSLGTSGAFLCQASRAGVSIHYCSSNLRSSASILDFETFTTDPSRFFRVRLSASSDKSFASTVC
jgi:hypothetical protein